jgi:hypothetical protein
MLARLGFAMFIVSETGLADQRILEIVSSDGAVGISQARTPAGRNWTFTSDTEAKTS